MSQLVSRHTPATLGMREIYYQERHLGGGPCGTCLACPATLQGEGRGKGGSFRHKVQRKRGASAEEG